MLTPSQLSLPNPNPTHPIQPLLPPQVRKLERHMDAAKQAANTREFGTAASEYTEALTVADAPQHAPLSAALHAERGAARLRLKEYDQVERARSGTCADPHKTTILIHRPTPRPTILINPSAHTSAPHTHAFAWTSDSDSPAPLFSLF